jgi:GNAT superfamily N-acetyltransferase
MITFKLNPPVKPLMIFEETFDPELRQTLKEKRGLLELCTRVGAMLKDGKYIGEWYGFNMRYLNIVDDYLDCKEYPHDPEYNYPQFGKLKIDPDFDFYCHSNSILPDLQGQGYGSIMKAWMLAYLKGTGFTRVLGHAHTRGSINLNRKFGCIEHHSFKNWYNTGHEYILYSIKL